MNDEIRLIIPAKQSMVLVARMALAGFCSQCGADIDTLDDIRTLCDEACYCLMHQPKTALTITVLASWDGVNAHIRTEAAYAPNTANGQAAHDPEIARSILSTLATDVRMVNDQGIPYAIEALVRLAPL